MSFSSEFNQVAKLYKCTDTGTKTASNTPIFSQVYLKDLAVRVSPFSSVELRIDLATFIGRYNFYLAAEDITVKDTLEFEGEMYNILSADTYYDSEENLMIIIGEKIQP